MYSAPWQPGSPAADTAPVPAPCFVQFEEQPHERHPPTMLSVGVPCSRRVIRPIAPPACW